MRGHRAMTLDWALNPGLPMPASHCRGAVGAFASRPCRDGLDGTPPGGKQLRDRLPQPPPMPAKVA
jgi:hypothetical protein